jgi:flagellar hook protein FlgE
MAIQGGGYFVLGNGTSQHFYTRDGSFNLSPDGTLEAGAIGMTVQGWVADPTTGILSTATPLGTIKLPLSSVNVSPTTSAVLGGNLDSTQAVYVKGTPPTGGSTSTAITVYDSQGTPHELDLTLQKTAANTWSYTFAAPAVTGKATADFTLAGATGSLTFDANGALTSTPPTAALTLTYANSTTAGAISVDFSKISQVASSSQVNVSTVDGSAAGTLSTFSVGKNGVVTAIYSNGTNKQVGQIALADFRNPDDLLRQGNNLYTEGVNSGKPQVGAAGTGTLGPIATGQLEGSNVDLAAQFGQMIQAQQGFNSNTKVITTTNNMLQAVISIVP